MSTTNVMPVPHTNPPHAGSSHQGTTGAGTSKGTGLQTIYLTSNAVRGDHLAVHHSATRIVLQLRHQPPGDDSLLSPSFQIGFELTPGDALSLASTLLALATPRIHSVLQKAQQERTDAP